MQRYGSTHHLAKLATRATSGDNDGELLTTKHLHDGLYIAASTSIATTQGSQLATATATAPALDLELTHCRRHLPLVGARRGEEDQAHVCSGNGGGGASVSSNIGQQSMHCTLQVALAMDSALFLLHLSATPDVYMRV